MTELLLVPAPLLLAGWLLAVGSPGPATLAILGASMGHGRRAGLTLAAGVVVGSATWGLAAALGLSAVMLSTVWAIEVIRYAGAGYLLFLALKSLRAAWRGTSAHPVAAPGRRFFGRGLALHLANPKAILSWGAIYAIALAPGAGPEAVLALFAVLAGVSAAVFVVYAILFSSPPVARGYARARRWFDAAFGILFGAASIKLLTARLQ